MGFLKHFWYGCKLANISKSKLAMCYKGLKNIQNFMRNCMSEISAKGNREMDKDAHYVVIFNNEIGIF